MTRFGKNWGIRAMLCLMLVCLTMSVGCKEDPMTRARQAHLRGDAAATEAALKEVLAASPDDFEAKLLMAGVPAMNGDFAATEAAYKKLWEGSGFDDEAKELTPTERAQRDMLLQRFDDMYDRWLDSIGENPEDPELYLRVNRGGLELNPKSPTFNMNLVDFYRKRAEALEKEGKPLEAAEAWEEILQLRAMRDVRKTATEKSAELRKAAFVDKARARFEGETKPKLVENEQWIADGEKVTFVVEASVDRKLRQNREADLAEARKQAAPAIQGALRAMLVEVTGLPAEEVAMPKKIDSAEENLSRGKYTVRITFGLDDALEAAFAASEAKRTAAEKGGDEEAEKEPAKEAAEGDAAGEDKDGGAAPSE